MSAKKEIEDIINRSREAQKQIENYTQEQVDELIKAMVWSVAKPGMAEEIAQFTVDETQLGNYDGKFLKIQRKTRATLMDIIDDKSVGILEEDPERAIVKIAKPMGVIGALSPSTNPEATPVIKSIHAIKGRNSIIVAPHPRAKLTNKKICDLMREAIVKCGAPADLVQAIEIPSLELTNELMAQCDRVLATGGGAMVNAAYSSGTPALGVGVGNAVITVDETADLDDASEKIRISKTLDLAASCSSDNSVILVDSIYDEMIKENQDDLWNIFYMRGICYEQKDEWDLAEKDFLRSLEIKPGTPNVLNYLDFKEYNIQLICIEYGADYEEFMAEKGYKLCKSDGYVFDHENLFYERV